MPPRLLLFLGLMLPVASCTPSSSDAQTGAADSTTLATTSAAPASDADTAAPQTVVRQLYRAHDASLARNKGLFISELDTLVLGQFFTRQLTRLLWQDVVTAQAEGYAPTLDADPLYATQDKGLITDFRVGTPVWADGRQRAELPVSFRNETYPTQLRFYLQRENGAWRISDIEYPGQERMLQLLSGQ